VRWCRIAGLGSLLVALCAPLPALAITVVEDDAQFTELTGPQDFRSDGPLQSNTAIYWYQEQNSLVLAADLTVNAVAPGTYTTSPGTSIIASGTTVDVILLHMDVTTTTTFGGSGNTAGSITFDDVILGVIGAAAELDASDLAVGDPSSSYTPAPTARHTWEASDSLTISADRRTLTIDSLRVGSTQPWADQIRVIFAPEPNPAVLLLLGFVGLSLRERVRSR
jgi:hypothetical protein